MFVFALFTLTAADDAGPSGVTYAELELKQQKKAKQIQGKVQKNFFYKSYSRKSVCTIPFNVY